MKMTMPKGSFASYQITGQKKYIKAWNEGSELGKAKLIERSRNRSAWKFADIFAGVHILLIKYEQRYGIEVDYEAEAIWGLKYRDIRKKDKRGDGVVPDGWTEIPAPHFDKTHEHPFTDGEANYLYDALYNKPICNEYVRKRFAYRIRKIIKTAPLADKRKEKEEVEYKSVDDIISRHKSLENFCSSFRLVKK